jgi:hypothetical protein
MIIGCNNYDLLINVANVHLENSKQLWHPKWRMWYAEDGKPLSEKMEPLGIKHKPEK